MEDKFKEMRALNETLDKALAICMVLENEVPEFINISGKVYNSLVASQKLMRKLQEGK